MSVELIRLVVRVPVDLPGAVTDIVVRLFEETMMEYSDSAVIRGLLSLGLAKVAENQPSARLAPLFAGARIPRGRKRGKRWVNVADLDLTKEKSEKIGAKPGEPVTDLVFEDEHNDHRLDREAISREVARRRQAAARGGDAEPDTDRDPKPDK